MKLLICLLLTSSLALSYAKLQTARATGQLVCAGVPVRFANVTIWEKDTMDPDDKFGTVKTDIRGHFDISMEESEITKIKPYLVITHKCNAKHDNCHRESTFNIPEKYVFEKAKTPHEPWNAGKIELHVDARDGDKRICDKKN
uniref:Uncharacterized protein n=1 Tax=Acrobeloides nanus TaxID=290746 RepID=A0A914CSX4_9BILA